MAITLFTGVPGAGKTLRSIFEGLEMKGKGRPVFHIGIDGMKEDIIPASPYPIEEWKKLPAGSVLIVDEAHKYFPVRQPGKPPEWIQDLTEIRHFGIELYLVTQDPRNLDAFVRRLIGVHKHLSRKAGLKGAMLRTFQGVSEDPNDWSNRQSSEQTPWLYPKHLFQVYDSASLHVISPKIPKKIIFAGLILLAAVIGIPYALYNVKSTVSGLDDKTSPSSASASSSFGSSVEEKEDPWSSPEAFVRAHTPLIPGIPWSTPIYAGKTPVSDPRIYCVASGTFGSKDRTCHCYTEQATRIDNVPTKVCETAVIRGVYNPYAHAPSPGMAAGGASVEGAPAPVSITPNTEIK